MVVVVVVVVVVEAVVVVVAEKALSPQFKPLAARVAGAIAFCNVGEASRLHSAKTRQNEVLNSSISSIRPLHAVVVI